jgi:diaminopimelate epimerase
VGEEPLIPAAKYHSYGNDFFIVSSEDVPAGGRNAFAVSICDPHFGVGADGCIFLHRSASGLFELRIFNRDGGEAGMSGNGVRCACAHLHRRGLADSHRVTFLTASGSKIYELVERQGLSWKYRSEMGLPGFSSDVIPFRSDHPLDRVENYPLEAAGRRLDISALSIGNPQCVVFCDELPAGAEFELVGAALEAHPAFPERTNVSFVKVKDSHHLEIRIWERGVGPTFSSGTGSCGAAVAAIAGGRASSPLRVQTGTGIQQVEWSPGQEIILTGWTHFIADLQYHWVHRDESATD